MKAKSKIYLGFVLLGTGSSWHYGASPEQAAEKAARVTVNDWSRLFGFGESIKVNIFDITEHQEGWYFDDNGMTDEKTHQRIARHSVVEVPTPKIKKRR